MKKIYLLIFVLKFLVSLCFILSFALGNKFSSNPRSSAYTNISLGGALGEYTGGGLGPPTPGYYRNAGFRISRTYSFEKDRSFTYGFGSFTYSESDEGSYAGGTVFSHFDLEGFGGVGLGIHLRLDRILMPMMNIRVGDPDKFFFETGIYTSSLYVSPSRAFEFGFGAPIRSIGNFRVGFYTGFEAFRERGGLFLNPTFPIQKYWVLDPFLGYWSSDNFEFGFAIKYRLNRSSE